MTIIDRAGRALTAHRNALLEIDRGGHSADVQFILDALTEINHWGDRDQRADLISEILDALEAGELDETALRSLASTEEYLNPGGWESGTCTAPPTVLRASGCITGQPCALGCALFCALEPEDSDRGSEYDDDPEGGTFGPDVSGEPESLTCPRQVVVWEVRDSMPTRKRCGRPVADDSPSFYCTRHANN